MVIRAEFRMGQYNTTTIRKGHSTLILVNEFDTCITPEMKLLVD